MELVLNFRVFLSLGDQGGFEAGDTRSKLRDLRVLLCQHVHSDGGGLVALAQIDEQISGKGLLRPEISVEGGDVFVGGVDGSL